MKQRAITEKQIVEIIEFPEYTLKRGEEIEAYKRINSFMTKVVYIVKESYIKIITVYQLT